MVCALCRALQRRWRSALERALPVGGRPRFRVFRVTVFRVTVGVLFLIIVTAVVDLMPIGHGLCHQWRRPQRRHFLGAFIGSFPIANWGCLIALDDIEHGKLPD